MIFIIKIFSFNHFIKYSGIPIKSKFKTNFYSLKLINLKSPNKIRSKVISHQKTLFITQINLISFKSYSFPIKFLRLDKWIFYYI